MKNSDQFSRRFLMVSAGLSIILLSASLFVFSLRGISSAQASDNDRFTDWKNEPTLPASHLRNMPAQDDPDEDIKAIYAFGVGIRDGNLYFGILYSNNTIGLHRAPADGEDVLDW